MIIRRNNRYKDCVEKAFVLPYFHLLIHGIWKNWDDNIFFLNAELLDM